jgi:hypothetical protein
MGLDTVAWVLFIVAALVLLAVLGRLFLRPHMLRWGATKEEAAGGLPGDELIPAPVMRTTRAIDIHAPPEQVWPWLAQMGQGRAGFYSYDWLENLAGMDIHNVQRIVPELQDLRCGDLIPFWKGAGVNVIAVEPPKRLVLAGTLNQPGAAPAAAGGTWVFCLSANGEQGTRLLVRAGVARFKPGWLCIILMALMEPMHFIMERKMMLRIKELAEQKNN